MGEFDQTDTDEIPFSQRPVIILGAGIIGCATARQLLLNGFPVVVVAEYLPGDQSIYYASAWAGAAWHAAGGIGPDQRYLQAVTYRILLKMAQDGPEAGVSIVNAREYLEQRPGPDSAIWGRTVVSKVNDGFIFALVSLGLFSPNDPRRYWFSFVGWIPGNILPISTVPGHMRHSSQIPQGICLISASKSSPLGANSSANVSSLFRSCTRCFPSHECSSMPAVGVVRP